MPNYRISYNTKARKISRVITLSGNLSSWSYGRHPTRFGVMRNGIKLVYVHKIQGGTGREGRIKKMVIEKVIPVPQDAYGIKVRKR